MGFGLGDVCVLFVWLVMIDLIGPIPGTFGYLVIHYHGIIAEGATDDNADSPLLKSCRSGSLKGVKELVRRGARVHETNTAGDTCLTVAAACVLVSLEHVYVNHASAEGFTALHWAAWNQHTGMMEVLIQTRLVSILGVNVSLCINEHLHHTGMLIPRCPM